MDVLKAITTRKSVRAYKPEPVSQKVLKEILEIAVKAPSGENKQPWEFYVINGKTLEKIKEQNIVRLKAGASLQIEHGTPKGTVFRERQICLAKELFRLMDIPREDELKRLQWLERGFRYFDAPTAIIIVTDNLLSMAETLLDVGALTQTICLAALKYGLGSCIEGQGIAFPDVLRQYAGIDDNKRIVTSIAIGYPDWDFPANKIKSKREPVENIINWCD